MKIEIEIPDKAISHLSEAIKQMGYKVVDEQLLVRQIALDLFTNAPTIETMGYAYSGFGADPEELAEWGLEQLPEEEYDEELE